MKKILSLFVIPFCFSVNAQTVYEVTYEEKFPDGGFVSPYDFSYDNLDCTDSLTDDLSCFEVLADGADEKAIYSLNKALQLWQEKIVFDNEIVIELVPDSSLPSDIAFNSVVTFSSGTDKVFYPTSLLKQQGSADFSGCDISIHYNADMSLWSFDDGSTSDKYNFTTAMLRALARGFGFGTGLNGSDGNIGFRFPAGYSMAYDRFVVDESGTALSSLEPRSAELSAFVRGAAYFNVNDKSDYKLYSPAVFSKNESLCYFDDSIYDEEKALMYPSCNNPVLHIGDKVVDVLVALGWTENPGAEIVSGDVPEDGVVDYRQGKMLEFTCNLSSSMSEIRWVYEVKMDGGGYYEVASSVSDDFRFVLPELFDIVSEGRNDLSGDIESRVRLNAVIGGVEKELLCPVWVRGGRLVEITGIEQQADNPDRCDVGFRFYTSQPGSFIRYFDIWGIGGVAENLGYLETGMYEFTVKDVYYDLDYVLSLSRYTETLLEQGMDIPIRIETRKVHYLDNNNVLCVAGDMVTLGVFDISGVLLNRIISAGEYDFGGMRPGIYIVSGIIDGVSISEKIIVR